MAVLAIILGAVGGALGMFFFDPRNGNRRRSLLRDQVVRFSNRAPDKIDAVSRQVQDRVGGMVAEAKSRLNPTPADDETLAARVRSEMGRYVSHPGALTVSAYQGEITISGAILTDEAAPMLAAIMRVPGVTQIHDHLVHYEHAEGIPDLQGGVTRPEMR
jgi:hypothetical protein